MSEAPRRASAEYSAQVSESIRSVFELTTRIDERVQIMMKKQEELERKIDAPMALSQAIATRVAILESKTTVALEAEVKATSEEVRVLASKVQDLEGTHGRTKEGWKQAIGFVVQLLWVVVAAYVLYKLKLQGPP
jgi:polyhydroxyalkanoate synthesis regulator phasin